MTRREKHIVKLFKEGVSMNVLCGNYAMGRLTIEAIIRKALKEHKETP